MKEQKQDQPGWLVSEGLATSSRCRNRRPGTSLPADSIFAVPLFAMPPCSVALYAVMFSALCILASCIPDPSQWFPTGKAEIISFREIEEGGFKSGMIVLKLENTGRGIIHASTVSVSLATDARRYYRTVTESTTILPGGVVFTDLEFPYDVSEEKVSDGGPTVENFFFE